MLTRRSRIKLFLECCLELTLIVTKKETSGQLSNFTGHYIFDYKNVTMEEVKNGSLVFKKENGKGYVFRNENGSWVVRNPQKQNNLQLQDIF